MSLVILTPDGVGIRNFVVTFLKRYQGGRVTVMHCLDAPVLERIVAPLKLDVEWLPLVVPPERPVPFTLRHTLSYAHVYWADTLAMRYNRSRKTGGSWRTRAANSAARLVGRAASSSEAGVHNLEKLFFYSAKYQPEFEHYRKLFAERRPSLVLSSSQQSPRVLLPILAARSLGIPTVAFIGSWDNLTTKGRLAAPFDYFLVWSENMKRELLQFYPRIAAERVHVVGTPQFDSYTDPELESTRERFFESLGADLSRPLVCFSGGDHTTCPEDQDHLRIVMAAVREGRIRHNPQVVLRPSPVDPGDRYASVRRDYPELIYMPPAWEHPEPGNWAKCIPMPEDGALLANLTRYADMNINVASTMTLDFGIRDKPVVNIAFDVKNPPPFGIPLAEMYYPWEHYKPVVDGHACRVARSAAELVEQVNAYLDNPALDREGRRWLVEYQVGAPIGQSSQRIAAVLEKLADMPGPVSGLKIASQTRAEARS